MSIKVPIAITMAYLMMFTSVVGAAAGAVPPEERVKQVKQSITAIPAGAVVEVKLLNKEKFQGRLGAVAELSFQVQVAKGEKIEDRTVRLGEVKSIQHLSKEHPVSKGIGKGVLVFFAVFGAIGLICLIVVAAR